jgi:chemotaxis protein MotB
MRKRGADAHEIIIKRRAKKGHDEAHGGAWKVAFADFTLAMMALFMVLWIVQPRIDTPTSEQASLNDPLVDGGAGIFDGRSITPLDLDGIPIQVAPRRDEQNQALNPQSAPRAGSAPLLGDGSTRLSAQELAKLSPQQREQLSQEQLALLEKLKPYYGEPQQMRILVELMEQLAQQLDAQANIEVQVVPQGLRILIKDDQQHFMFSRGSSQLDPRFAKMLQSLAVILGKVHNPLIISGHTDAMPYRGVVGGYNNWNLSGDRALRARNVMVEAGLPAAAVLQVTAQADGAPLLPADPQNGANRRIELLVLTSQAEQLYRDLFGEGQLRADLNGPPAAAAKPQG